MAAKKRKTADQDENVGAAEAAVSTIDAPTASVDAPVEQTSADDVARPFIGQWNRLVSTTNWEKGRIIAQWRDALEQSGAAVTEYSDEAWAQLVGGVTSQHIGRLRRAYQRFGGVFDQYDGLYWSHFQAAIDWTDAEMWLEGAILQNWSVSQMRGKRWETLGNPGDPPAEDAAALETEDVDDSVHKAGDVIAGPIAEESGSTRERTESSRSTAEDDEHDGDDAELDSSDDDAPFDVAPTAASPAKARKPLAVDVDDLPADLADAFEAFKLAIISQRRTGWRDATPEAVIECLDALRQLALAPVDD
jgi:hypothetical protein